MITIEIELRTGLSNLWPTIAALCCTILRLMISTIIQLLVTTVWLEAEYLSADEHGHVRIGSLVLYPPLIKR